VKKSAVLKKSWVFSILIGSVCAAEPEKTDFSYEERFPRVYQWNDTHTGTPHLSGRMPYWYEGKIQHPNPPCTIVWQRGTIIDDTCEKDPQKAAQYRQNTKNFLDDRDERIARLKYLNKLREEGRVEFDLSEEDVLYILGEPKNKTKTMTETIFKYDYNFWVYFKLGRVVKFDEPKH